MDTLVSLFIVLAALVTMVGVMWMVLREKHVDESTIKYVQSPYPQPPAKPAEPVRTVDKVAGQPESVAPDVTPESVEEAVTSVADSIDVGVGQPTSPDDTNTSSEQPEA